MKTYEVKVIYAETFEVQAVTPQEADATIWRLHRELRGPDGALLNDSSEGDPIYWVDSDTNLLKKQIVEVVRFATSDRRRLPLPI